MSVNAVSQAAPILNNGIGYRIEDFQAVFRKGPSGLEEMKSIYKDLREQLPASSFQEAFNTIAAGYSLEGAQVLEWLLSVAGDKIPDINAAFAQAYQDEPFLRWMVAQAPNKISLNGFSQAAKKAAELPTEQVLPLMQCLFQIGGESIRFGEAFEVIAKKGQEGVPILKWLLENTDNKKLYPYMINSAFTRAPYEKDPLVVMRLILEHRFESIVQNFSSSTKDTLRVLVRNQLPILPFLKIILAKPSIGVSKFDSYLPREALKGQEALPIVEYLLGQYVEKVVQVRGMEGHIAFPPVEEMPNRLTAMMEFLIDAGVEQISSKEFKSLLEALRCVPNLPIFPLIKRFLENPAVRLSDYDNFLLEATFHTPEFIAAIDYLLGRLVLLHGTDDQVVLSRCVFLAHPSEEVIQVVNSHLKTKGLEWKKSEDSDELLASFCPIFESCGPEGLPFLESTCREKADQLSSFTLNWAFLKAAANGPAAQQFMEWLSEHVPDKLTYWAFSRALQISKKYGHEEMATWLEQNKPPLTPPQNLDIKLLLASSYDPSGFSPLGDAPERFHWEPLTEQALSQYGQLPAQSEENLFDVIVEDSVENPALHQIRKSEATLFSKLYAHIKAGNTPFKIIGDDVFKAKILAFIQKLLKRPSGRWALLFGSQISLQVKNGDRCAYDFGKKELIINPKERGSFCTKTVENVYEAFEQPLDVGFFHELLHAIHSFKNPELAKLLGRTSNASRGYSSLEEQITIASVDSECDRLEAFALSENTYNFEQGYPRRYFH